MSEIDPFRTRTTDLATDHTATTDPALLGGNVRPRQPSPEELQAYARLQVVVEEQLKRP